MNIIYILLMVWSTSSPNGGVAIVQQEFNSRETCEIAREAMAKAHNEYNSALKMQGCFKK